MDVFTRTGNKKKINKQLQLILVNEEIWNNFEIQYSALEKHREEVRVVENFYIFFVINVLLF